MTKFFFKLKEPIFGLFPPQKSGCHAQLPKSFFHPGKIQRNLTQTQTPRKHSDRCHEGG